MIEVGAWLTVVGLCDLVRAARDATSWSRRSVIALAGCCLLVFAAVALQVSTVQTLLLLLAWVPFFLLWLLGSAAALGCDNGPARTAAFTGLAGGTVLGVLTSGLAPLQDQAPYPFTSSSLDSAVVLVGVALAQVSTANIAVRLLLQGVGVPAAANEKRLKGGRVLGPMERLFIVGLSLAGELTAAAIVVAAKGLLRFPELQSSRRDATGAAADDGPSDVSEYFLIGSFASWLFALSGLGLVAASVSG